MYDKLEKLLILHEGLRLTVYDDATGKPLKPGDTLQGYPTIGCGRNLVGRGITLAEAYYLLGQDLRRVDRELLKALPWYRNLDEVRVLVLTDMAFNLGMTKFLKFKKTLAACKAGKYHAAADHMLESAWAEQTGQRAVRLSEMMRSGKLPLELAGGR